MFKKSDILPLILALMSTALVLGVGLLWLTKIDIANPNNRNNASNNSLSTEANNNSGNSETNLDSVSNSSSSQATSSKTFPAPDIVPMGTAISINGSTRMVQINKALKRGFHKQFPGTAITTDADGSSVGMELLSLGKIDLAAINRPLNKQEKARGLAAVNISGLTPDTNQGSTPEVVYYVYRQPASDEVEAFLGYALSFQGQEAIFE